MINLINVSFKFLFFILSFYCMKIIPNILITFLIYIVTICANAFCDEFSAVDTIKRTDTVFSFTQHKTDFVATKNNETITQTAGKDETLNLNNKFSGNTDGNWGNCFFFYNSQFKKILNYLYTLSFLEIKSKIRFSQILTEIFPNAP